MSSGFITETAIEEAKKRRQEEWLKARTENDPIERPEEPLDNRSLYERLKEQKMKKDLEFEETHKLKNLIRGLDDDEVHFLDLVDTAKLNAERKQQLEEQKELKEFREQVANLRAKSIEEKIQTEIKAVNLKPVASATLRPSQKNLLSGVVRKRKVSEISKDKTDSEDKDDKTNNNNTAANKSNDSANKRCVSPIINVNNSFDKGALKCLAILPGIGRYRESSDSEMSSDSDEEALSSGRFDLLGRRKKRKCEEE